MSAAILLGVFSQLENWKRDLTTNFARLDPESPDRSLRPLMIQRSPADVAAVIEQWASMQPRWTVESRQDTGATIAIHLTRKTKLARFTDDIHVQLAPRDGGTHVEAESQSRLGKADFGQNPRNLRELVSGLLEDR